MSTPKYKTTIKALAVERGPTEIRDSVTPNKQQKKSRQSHSYERAIWTSITNGLCPFLHHIDAGLLLCLESDVSL